MTITLTLDQADIDTLTQTYPVYPYEIANQIAERARELLEQQLDDAFLADLAARHWDADDRLMVETGPDVLAELADVEA